MKENNIGTRKAREYPPYKCKVCGLYHVPFSHDTCDVCGWAADAVQDNDHDYVGGENNMSLNQYKSVWQKNMQRLMGHKNSPGNVKSHLVERLYEESGGIVKRPYISEAEKLQSRLEAEWSMANETQYARDKLKKKIRLARNEFKTVGKYELPLIFNQGIDPDTIDLMCLEKAKVDDADNSYKTIHFFTYDWNFETVYSKPDAAMEKLGQYYALLSPGFNVCADMPVALQLYSTFKNRWCGAYWQSLGKRVIPTIVWGGEDTFDFCFDAVEEGSVVAVSTYGGRDKDIFMRGYNKMLEAIKPSAVICYGEPFKEMKGNIKFVSAYNHAELVKKLGLDEYVKKQFAGDVYPSG